MAHQKSVIKIDGSLDGMTFYRSEGRYMVRAKGGISGDLLRNDSRFVRVRENWAEFGRAGQAGKLFREAIRPLLRRASDNRVASRLQRLMLTILQADPVNERGERQVMLGDLELLSGFDLNRHAPHSAVVKEPYAVVVNRPAGEVSLQTGNYAPRHAVAFPQGATHMRWVTGAVAVDFGTGKHVTAFAEADAIELTPDPVDALSVTLSMPVGNDDPWLVVMGVLFYQQVNGRLYPLINGAHNALAIVRVDTL